jgi:hypothetical protein
MATGELAPRAPTGVGKSGDFSSRWGGYTL